MAEDAVRVVVLIAAAAVVFGVGAHGGFAFFREDERVKTLTDHDKLGACLQALAAEVRDCGFLQQEPPRQEEMPAWLRQARSDPGSALAELRRQLEARCKKLAAPYDPRADRKHLVELVNLLKDRGVISPLEHRTLQDVRELLHDATHARAVGPLIAVFVLQIAPGLLALLDRRVGRWRITGVISNCKATQAAGM